MREALAMMFDVRDKILGEMAMNMLDVWEQTLVALATDMCD
jgi:hypothetical protein